MNHEVSSEAVVLVGHITRKRGKSVRLVDGKVEEKKRSRPLKVARMLALAHMFQRMIHAGVVKDHSELARLTGFSNARITQLMNLTFLAPSIQEEILGMTVERGRDRVTERSLRKVVEMVEWGAQEQIWQGSHEPPGQSAKLEVSMLPQPTPFDSDRAASFSVHDGARRNASVQT